MYMMGGMPPCVKVLEVQVHVFYICGEEVNKLKRFKFRLQVVLDMRENELEQRQMEMAKILAMLKQQENKLQEISDSQIFNTKQMEELYNLDSLDISQIESHRNYGLKLIVDARNQERIINNTKSILKVKQQEVTEAHKKVEILSKLKEKQEKQYYKSFLDAEIKEIDDITSARFRIK